MPEVTLTNFGEWLVNAGLSGPTLHQRGDGWTVWSAQSYQDGFVAVRWYVFANTSCSWAELEQAAGIAATNAGPARYTVIFPNPHVNQLSPRNHSRLSSIIPNGNPISLRRLYYSAAMNHNLHANESFGAENFVEQRVSFPGFDEPQPALRVLVQWLRGEIKTNQKVIVLLAPGGQGKTTVARQIFHHFTANQFEATIPVLINRHSWERNQDIVDLDDVWRCGIRASYPDAGITGEMLRNCLSLGTFCPIFDGLDELCTIYPWDFKPDDVVRDLIDTFEGSFEGRLLVTSRRSFWDQYISANLHGKVIEVDLHNFTLAERDRYLQNRFPSESGPIAIERQARANRILARIASRVSTYVPSTQDSIRQSDWQPYKNIESLPFVVMLAADSADTDKSDLSAAYGSLLQSSDPLRGLLLAICNREQLRHALPADLNADAQLKLLETLASEFGPHASDEDMEITLSECRLPSNVKDKFGDHSLIIKRRGEYEFVYEFVFDYLCASVLMKWLQGQLHARSGVNALVLCAEQPGDLLDGAADLVLSVCGMAWVALAQARYAELSKEIGIDRRWQAGFFHFVHALTRNEPQHEYLLEKLSLVFGTGLTRTLGSFFLEGAIDNLDFRGITFRGVTFAAIEFAHCQFDETTLFEDCIFSSTLEFENCRGAGLLTLIGGSISAQARSAFQREQVRGVDNRLTTDQIEDAVRFVLKKFNRGTGSKSVMEENIRGSAKSSYAFGNEVIDQLVKHQVLESFQSATRHNLKVMAKGDVYEFFHNNYMRGKLKEAYDELTRRLVK